MLKGLIKPQRLQRKNGVASFLEIVITAVIFAIAAAGILTTISALRPHGAESARRLEAAYVGRSIMEELRAETDWDGVNSSLAVGVNFSRVVGAYTANWWLENVAGLDVRQLHMEVTY